jgi:hypothetical protein
MEMAKERQTQFLLYRTTYAAQGTMGSAVRSCGDVSRKGAKSAKEDRKE